MQTAQLINDVRNEHCDKEIDSISGIYLRLIAERLMKSQNSFIFKFYIFNIYFYSLILIAVNILQNKQRCFSGIQIYFY